MQKRITHVALDDSKRTIVAGILRPGAEGPDLRQLPNEPRHLRRLLTRLTREGPVKFGDVAALLALRFLPYLPSTCTGNEKRL